LAASGLKLVEAFVYSQTAAILRSLLIAVVFLSDVVSSISWIRAASDGDFLGDFLFGVFLLFFVLAGAIRISWRLWGTELVKWSRIPRTVAGALGFGPLVVSSFEWHNGRMNEVWSHFCVDDAVFHVIGSLVVSGVRFAWKSPGEVSVPFSSIFSSIF
jgi:hypothetical protein